MQKNWYHYTMIYYDDFITEPYPLFLREGEGIFYVSDVPLRDMLCALCGISGNFVPDVTPRLLLAEAEDASSVSACFSDAARWGAPVLLCGDFPKASPVVASLSDTVICRQITRPFLFTHFRAAAYALLTMSNHPPANHTPVPPQRFVRFDPQRSEVVYGELRQSLRPREAALFQLLLQASPEPVSRAELAAGFLRNDSNAVDVYIGYLRRKLTGYPLIIQSVRGQGYALILSLGEE